MCSDACIYLTLILAAASFAYAGSFKTIRKSFLCAFAFIAGINKISSS
jgi:hypothetical protein